MWLRLCSTWNLGNLKQQLELMKTASNNYINSDILIWDSSFLIIFVLTENPHIVIYKYYPNLHSTAPMVSFCMWLENHKNRNINKKNIVRRIYSANLILWSDIKSTSVWNAALTCCILDNSFNLCERGGAENSHFMRNKDIVKRWIKHRTLIAHAQFCTHRHSEI